MKRLTLTMMTLLVCLLATAEDGSRLWLRNDKVEKARVAGPQCLAAEELRDYY